MKTTGIGNRHERGGSLSAYSASPAPRSVAQSLLRFGSILLLLCGVLLAPTSSTVGVAVWVSAGSLNVTSAVSSVTLLADGRVLVTGSSYSSHSGELITGREVGRSNSLPVPPSVPTAQPETTFHASAEVYDPADHKWTKIAPLSSEQGSIAPVLLKDGNVLFTGGYSVPSTPSSFHTLNSAQVYQPSTNSWRSVAPMGVSRFQHTATLLRDGTVLVVGGVSGGGERPGATGSAERYDPRTNSWSPAGTLQNARAQHAAVLLADGRVLVIGGYDPQANAAVAGAEIYDPTTDAWSSGGSLLSPRVAPTAILLNNGQMLVAGGQDQAGPVTAIELYDPTANRWNAAAPMNTGRSGYSVTLLADGTVLVAGGLSTADSTPLASAEIYDPVTGKWAGAAPMISARSNLFAALLRDGGVLVVGQVGPLSGGGELPPPAVAEIYTQSAQAQTCFPETGKCVSGPFLAYWQTHGGLALNGYPISGEFIQALEDGRAYQVQYFERVRMEYHPENGAPYDVLLGQFGRRIHPADPPVAPQPGASYFKETGHNLSGSFLAYWQAHGGLMQFGYPISEEVAARLENGKTYVVQYFERARFEHHPENVPPYEVLLGHFGWLILNRPILHGQTGPWEIAGHILRVVSYR